MTRDPDALDLAIAELVRPLLDRHGRPLPDDPAADLRASGLTSLDLVSLVLALEDAFDITVPEARMAPAELSSLNALRGLVEDVRAGDAASSALRS